MPRLNRMNIWVLISFLIGTVLGSGVVWQIANIHLASKSHELEVVAKTTLLRRQLSELHYGIIELSDEYIRAIHQYDKEPSYEGRSKLIRLKSELDMLKDDFKVLEGKLARIEGRKPRALKIDFVPPASIKDLSITVVR